MFNLNISVPELETHFIVFLRITAVLFTIPVFDSRSIPVVFKGGLALAICVILHSVTRDAQWALPQNGVLFVIGAMREITIGIIMGMSVKLVFGGIQLAGQFVGLQMGFAIGNVMDPVTGAQASYMGQLKNLIAILVFLAVDAHHWFLRGLKESFYLVPPFQFQFTDSLAEHLIRTTGNMFIICLKIGAPVMVALLLTSVALGFLARTVPQMNIFIVAFPIKIMVGLLFIGICLPYTVNFLGHLFSNMGKNLSLLLRCMGSF